jgi:tartrate-resistant acid phosphatase type 5
MIVRSSDAGKPMARRARNLLLAIVLLPSAASAQTNTIRFAAFGDFGNGPGADAVAALVKNQSPAFIVTTGDNCYGNAVPIATQVGNKYGAFVSGGRFFPALGNHEYSDVCAGTNASGYLSYFKLPNNERYYDFVRGPVHFFALNANGGTREPDGRTATSKQGQWLKAKLAASTSPWQIVYFHQPAFSSGRHGSTPDMNWPFELWGVDAVLQGHDHDYERILKDSNGDGKKLPYFVVGLGGQTPRAVNGNVSGSAIKYSAANGALFVTASPTTLKFEFRNTSGTVVDTYSMTRSATRSKTQFKMKVCC